MNPANIQQLVDGATELFSLPDIYMQLSEMIRDSRYSMSDIGAVISKDPALSARLLRVVNSPFYGFQARIDTISRAITVVGIDDLYNMVIATSVVDQFGDIPCELVDMTAYWMRSVHCAVIARILAKHSTVLHAERLFLAGLLHDTGSLVMYHKIPALSLQVLLATNHDRRLLAGFEQEIIGFTHADVGRELLKTWGLPESLYETIGCYLEPDQAEHHKLDAYLLHMAAQLVDCSKYVGGYEATITGFSDRSLALVRLTRAQIAGFLDQVEEEFLQVFELLSPSKKFH